MSEDSKTSSRPPSIDDPYRRGETGKPAADGGDEAKTPLAPAEKTSEPAEKKAAKPAGKRPGAKGYWRSQPIVTSADVPHAPTACAACGAGLGPDLKRRCVEAHNSLELVRGEMSLQVTATKHVYFAVRCPCGHETVVRPGVGSSSESEGRRRNLLMSERCLIGPTLATFIALLSVRFRLSRRKIQEFLLDWLGLELGAATINRCVHEFGLASEPVVERLIRDMRAATIIHLDEAPWYQKGKLRWMWVATTALETIFRIGGRRKEELTTLIGEAFLGCSSRTATARLPRSPPPPALPGAVCRLPDYAYQRREPSRDGADRRGGVGIIRAPRERRGAYRAVGSVRAPWLPGLFSPRRAL